MGRRCSRGRARLRHRRHAKGLKCFAVEEGGACPDAGTTRLLADRAVAMVCGMPSALLSTGRARTDAGHEQIAHGDQVPLSRARKNPSGDITDVGADQIERDAGSQVGDVLLDEIGVRARRAGLDAGEAGVDRGGELRRPDWKMRGGGIQHLKGLSHGLMKSTAVACDNNPSH